MAAKKKNTQSVAEQIAQDKAEALAARKAQTMTLGQAKAAATLAQQAMGAPKPATTQALVPLPVLKQTTQRPLTPAAPTTQAKGTLGEAKALANEATKQMQSKKTFVPLPTKEQLQKPYSGRAVYDSAFGGLTSFNAGLMSALDAYNELTAKYLFHGQKSPIISAITDPYLKANEEQQKKIQQNIESGKINPLTSTFLTSTVNTLPTVVTSALTAPYTAAVTGGKLVTGATKTASQILADSLTNMAKNPTTWLSFTQTFGNAYGEARESGASEEQALTAAVLNAVPNTIIEMAGGTESLVSDLATNQGAKGVWNILKRIAKSGGEEVTEELLQAPFEGLSKKATYAKDLPWFSVEENAVINPKEMSESALVAFLTAATLGAGGQVVSSVANSFNVSGVDVDIDTMLDAVAVAMDSGDEKVRQAGERLFDMIFADREQSSYKGGVINRVLDAARANPQNADEMTVIGRSYKTQQHQKRTENALREELKKILSVPNTRSFNEEYNAELQNASNEIKQTGKLSDETAQRLFDKAYENGVMVLDEYYQQYKPLRDELRQTKITISPEDAAGIADFNAFRRSNFGTLNIGKDGLAVYEAYAALSEKYSELFPDDVFNPADQLQLMSEVAKGITKTEQTLDEYYGEEAATMKEYARFEADKALERYADNIRRVAQVEKEDARRKLGTGGIVIESDEQARALSDELNAERHKIDRVKNSILLTDDERVFVDQVLNGQRTLEQIPPQYNAQGIAEMVNVSQRAHDIDQALNARKAGTYKIKLNRMLDVIRNSDKWEDKGAGWRYSRETATRNVQDIMKNDPETAQTLIREVFRPVQENEALRTKFLNQYRKRISDLELTKEERQLVQLLGEKKISENQLGANREKIMQAVEVFRQIYKELYDLANVTLVRNGYTTFEGLENYFPHFQEDAQFDMRHPVQWIQSVMNSDNLSTEIAGTTHTFKPGKKFSANLLHRMGNKTDYDAVKGFETYIDNISKIIYHTDDIQNLRALESAIRYKYSDEGAKEELAKNDEISDPEKAQAAEDEVFGEGAGQLGNFVTWLRGYTDSLAGKKAIEDRGTEKNINRGIYKLVTKWEAQIAKNMVSANLSSALTNFIPIVQATGEVDDKYLLQAMGQTIRNFRGQDGFIDQSSFLTSRRGSQRLDKNAFDKASDLLSVPFEAIDSFTTQVVTRAKYLQLTAEGVDPDTAMRRADDFAAGLIGDRSYGAVPTAFNIKNPLVKTLTMFQLEANNQFSYMFKDLPKHVREEQGKSLAVAALRMLVGSWLFNTFYEQLVGRRPAFDPIGWLVDLGADLADEEKPVVDTVIDAGKAVVEQVPFVGGIIGGGRFPIQAGLPQNIGKTAQSIAKTARGEQSFEKLGYDLFMNVAKPAALTLFPFGGANQLAKSAEGIGAFIEGGVYGVNSAGQKQLKYPVEQTPANFIRGALFGKSAYPAANEYYDNNFTPVTDLDADGTQLGKMAKIAQDLDLFTGRQEQKPTATTQTRDIEREANAKALPSVIKYTRKDAEGNVLKDARGNPIEEKVRLSIKEKRAYRDNYESLLPNNMQYFSEDVRDKIYAYAKETATEEALGETYSASASVKKAQEAVKAGIAVGQYYSLQDAFAKMQTLTDSEGKTVSTANRKRNMLLKEEGLTNEQKALLDKLLIQTGETKKDIDYTDRNSVAYSLMDDKQQKKYNAAESAFGTTMTVERYTRLKKLLEDTKGDKDGWGDTISGSTKANKIAALQKEGLSLEAAHEFYAIANSGSVAKGATKDEAILSTLDENGAARFKAAKTYFKSLSPTKYLLYADAVSTASGYDEKVSALEKMGFDPLSASLFVACSEVDKKMNLSDPSKIIYQTFSDAQKKAFSRVTSSKVFAKMKEYDFYYFYKAMGTGKKAEKLYNLQQAGLSAGQAQVFYNLVS